MVVHFLYERFFIMVVDSFFFHSGDFFMEGSLSRWCNLFYLRFLIIGMHSFS